MAASGTEQAATAVDAAPTGFRPAEDPLAAAALWSGGGEDVAIATVVRSWGSSPRPPGSRFVLTGSGRMAGSVSGGCIESEIALQAETVLATGTPVLLRFTVADERAWSVGLACGGEIEVFVERLIAEKATGVGSVAGQAPGVGSGAAERGA